MIFEYYPRGTIDYRSLHVTQFCEWDDYPQYMPEEPLWQPPFAITIPKGMCMRDHLLTKSGHLVTFNPPIYDRWTLENINQRFRKFRPSEIEHVPGTVVTFNTSFGDSYGHWISEVVPCFHIARMLRIPQYKFYLDMGRTDNYFKVDTLEALGFDCQRLFGPEYFPCAESPCFTCEDIIDAKTSPVIQADCVVFIRKTRYSWWARDFVRHTFLNLAKPERTDRRLYISRSQESRRHILNEDQVISLLTRYGFEIIQSDNFYRPYHEQIKMFREAHIVVTQRASIFYDLWFCKDDFKLVVLWQQDENKYPGIINKFQNVTNLMCEAVPSDDNPGDRNCDNIMVDVGQLEQSLIQMLD